MKNVVFPIFTGHLIEFTDCSSDLYHMISLFDTAMGVWYS